MPPMNSGSSTATVATLARSIADAVCRRARSARSAARHRHGGQLFAGTAEASLAPAVRGDRLIKRRRVEVRPQGVREIELGIGKLPQQEIADALFTSCADEQVWLRQVTQREMGQKVALGPRFIVT